MFKRPAVKLAAILALALALVGTTSMPANAKASAFTATSACPSVNKNWAGAGPFAVTVEPGGSAHTIYRPTDLGGLGCGTHPVIIWGNGTGASVSTYDALLKHFASHGFIVAAANTEQSGSGKEMLAGIDYLTQQNSSSSSAYFGKVDLSQVGATGHSQGGGGAIAAGADSRVDTTVPIQPGPQGTVSALRGPTFFLAGQLDFIVPALYVHSRYQQAGHVVGVYGELALATHFTPAGNGGGYRGPITAWMRFHLMGDEQARGVFFGASCGYCGSPEWWAFERNAKAQAVPGS